MDDCRHPIPFIFAMSECFASQQLMERLDQDFELAEQLIVAFLEDAPATLDRLHDACAIADCAEIELLAHRLKGALLNVNASSAVESIASLANVALQGDAALLVEPLHALEVQVAALSATLKSFIEVNHEGSYC